MEIPGPDILSSSPFQLPLPPLPRLQPSRDPVPDFLGLEPSELGQVRSPDSGSVTAFPSAPTTRSRSPSLPSLPKLPNGEGHSQGSSHYRSDSSAYFTALWGSPYELPSSSRAPVKGRLNRSRSSTLTIEESPLRGERKGRAGTRRAKTDEILRSPPVSRSTQELLRALAGHRDDTATKSAGLDVTRDWLQNHLARRNTLENRNWLSDESKSNDTESDNDEADENWLDFGTNSPNQNRPNNAGRVTKSRQPGKLPKQHNSMPSDATLTQKDFDSLLRGGSGRDPSSNGMATAAVQGVFPPRESSRADKPLPPAPHSRTQSESPNLMTEGAPPESPSTNKRPSIPSSASFQRAKKKVIWRGKTCTIFLPLEDGKDSDGKPKKYLTPEDVANRRSEWEKKGFATHGFDLSNSDEPEISRRGQSRDIYPDVGEWSKDWQKGEYRISIPNRKAWDDYVRELQEQKLRALGVSFGDEEPVKTSPTPSAPMSRQSSSQNSMVPSHPLSSQSANGFRLPAESTFSPPMSTSSNSFGRPLSAMSPGISQGPPPGFHFPRQSMAIASDQIYGQGLHFSNPSSSPHIASFQQQPYGVPLPVSRGVSPLIDSRRQSARNNTHSPISPIAELVSENASQGTSSLLPHMRPHEARIPSPMHAPQFSLLSGQIQLNGQRNVDPGSQMHAEPMRHISQPEIASPLPQGHRHNISESLQKEIDEAEYHLEEAIRKQIEKDDDELTRLPAKAANNPPEVLPDVQSKANTELPKKETKMFASDVETNPSLAGSPDPNEFDRETQSASNGHVHRKSNSTTKFNVNAPEFVFDPTKSLAPSVFAFGTKSIEAPNSSSFSASHGLHSKTTSNNSAFSSNFNVAAPAFTPGKFQTPGASSREFSFSSTMAALKPDAPSFTPGSVFGLSSTDNTPESAKIAPKLFPNFDYSEVAVPAKKSKAIPIVKPESVESDPSAHEDESGRVTRSDARQKRARHGGTSGDQVPMFATPSREASMEPTVNLVPTRSESPEASKDAADAIKSPLAATGQLKNFIDDLGASATSGASSSYEEGEIRKPSGSNVLPEASKDEVKDANLVNMTADKDENLSNTVKPPEGKSIEASPLEEAKVEKSEQVLDNLAQLPKSNPENPSPTPESKSKLSASAKPFNFNPVSNPFEPKTFIAKDEAAPAKPEAVVPPISPSMKAKDETITKPANVIVPKPKPIKAPLQAGLGASRYATQPVPALPEPIQKPVHEPKPLPEADKTMEARIMNGVSYIDAPYNVIDEVMKHLNGEDSDVGVERVPTEAWHSPVKNTERSSEQRPGPIAANIRAHPEARSEPLSVADAPTKITASPNDLQQKFQYLPERDYGSSDNAAARLVSKNARFSPSYRPQKQTDVLESPIHRLNSAEVAAVSDWDDAISSEDEAKFRARSGFFDNRVNELVGGVFEQRLRPLEQNLASISLALATLTSRSGSRRYRRSVSAEVEDSDADDEDDDTLQSRPASPLKDRKFERIKASILEALNAQKSREFNEDLQQINTTLAEMRSSLASQSKSVEVGSTAVPMEEFGKLQTALLDLKASVEQRSERSIDQSNAADGVANFAEMLAEFKSSLQSHQQSAATGDIKKIIEEAVSKQMRGKSQPVKSSQESATVEKLELKVSGLESMLKVAENRASDELKARREVEDTLAACQRDLKAAQADAAQYREAAEETESSLRSFLDDQQQGKQHMAMLEEVKSSLEKTVTDLTDKTVALQDTLQEYRASHAEQKQEIEEAKTHIKNLDEENQNLDRTIQALKTEIEDGIKHKEALRVKLERLQDDMATTAQHFARDQSSWRNKEEEHKAKHELQKARLEAEARTRERLELEIDRLEKQEKEAMKAKYLVEQIRTENKHLLGLLNDLRTKNHEIEEHSMKCERELHDLKESSRHEINRIMNATKADVSAANQQVHLLRDNLEAVIHRLEDQLEDSKNEASNLKKRYEVMLEEAAASKDTALREAAESREAAMQEHYRFHERTLDEAKASYERTLSEVTSSHERALEGIKAAHEQTINSTIEEHKKATSALIQEHERASRVTEDERKLNENHLQNRLALADEKVIHLQDRVVHLEEKLEIAKSAAQAAAEAARAARGSTPSPQQTTLRVAKGSDVPEKVSPQALRESILVLQEQLHQRESRIENLEDELSKVDREAPNRVKERDIEISWLRELLGVRLDDLQDIITTLSAESYDREAVRDAAIRLKANLQMEQQEKERAMAGGQQRFPSLSEITQSPRSLPLAAAAAWGNWRKGQSSLSSLAEMAVPTNNDGNQTPSRSSPQSFLSGLLTPPSTNMRTTPQASASAPSRHVSAPQQQQQRRPLGNYSTPKRQISSASTLGTRREQMMKMAPPVTPPLLRKASYDQDAPSEHYSLDRYINEAEEEAETTPSMTETEDDTADTTPTETQAASSSKAVLGKSVELES